MVALSIVALLATASLAAAQCVPATKDLITLQNMPAGGFPQPATGALTGYDNAGGSYGGENLTYVFNGGAAIVTPLAVDTGYWFFKFEPRECWDATGYNAFEFDYTAPAGADFQMTLTVHTVACLTNNCSANAASCPRSPDSTYVSIKQATVTTVGAVNHAVVPFALFDGNSFGNGSIDWRYIKDFTFIKFSVLNQPYTFNNFIVKAGCFVKPTTTNAAVPTVGGVVGAATTAKVPGATVTAGTTGAGSTTGGAYSNGVSGAIVSIAAALSIFAMLF
ncbi:hypothetical protein HK098_004940 [Nowakowskiella sp. JEL0407]|nr:hypothetical protein HK098_004940 [Nowakowskiella sp. JEL0407]